MNAALRILLLEDAPLDAELNERVLEKSGLRFQSRRVENEPDFLEALDTFRPDVILADFNLPNYDGLTALGAVRQRNPDLPFIFVTGALGEEKAVELLHQGADDYILKDRTQRLPQAIQRALQDTRRKQALRLSESRFGDLLENSSDWVWEISASFRFTYVSPRCQGLLGYEPEELLGHTPFELMGAEEAARVAMEFRRHAELHRTFTLLENACLHKNGRTVALETSGTPVMDKAGSFLGYRGISRDITERKRIEQALERRESIYSAIVNQAGNAIALIDIETLSFVEFNDMACKPLGYSREEFSELSMHDIETLDAKELQHKLETLLAAGSGEIVTQHKTRDRQVRDVRISSRVVRIGDRTYVASIWSDITEQKQTEAELKLHRERLEELVASRTSELQASQQEAERLSRVKSEFLANMSHEVRTPLNAILGFAQIGLRDSLGRKARETFARILDAGQLLQGVVDDILDYSKLEAGKLRIEQGVISLREVIDRLDQMAKARIPEDGPEFHLDLAPDLPASCKGDSLRLTQVLMNLLSNAIKFTAHGRIGLSAARSEDWLMFRVEDTGIGMSPEQTRRLFTPFEQADGSITRKYGGTGLGLTISKRLLSQMGGEIQVHSREDEGSRFQVRLPLRAPRGLLSSQAPASAGQTKQTPKYRRLEGLHILAAEDNEVNRLLLQDMLSGEGARLELVENGRQALESVRSRGERGFDLILMDVQMPEMDGYQATEHIRELAPDVPVIGLTAHALAEEREKCLASGMAEHVAKPVALEDLVTVIGRHVALRPASPAKPATPANTTAASGHRPDYPSNAHDLVDWPELRRKYQGREKFLRQLLATVLHSHTGKARLLRQATADKDYRQLAFHAHNLKGTSSEVLPDPLRELAFEMEQSASESEGRALELALQLAAGIECLIQETKYYMNQFIPDADVAQIPMSPSDSETMLELLSTLQELLTKDDTRALTLFGESRGQIGTALGKDVNKLQRQIEDFDFEGALETLRGHLSCVPGGGDG